MGNVGGILIAKVASHFGKRLADMEDGRMPVGSPTNAAYRISAPIGASSFGGTQRLMGGAVVYGEWLESTHIHDP